MRARALPLCCASLVSLLAACSDSGTSSPPGTSIAGSDGSGGSGVAPGSGGSATPGTGGDPTGGAGAPATGGSPGVGGTALPGTDAGPAGGFSRPQLKLPNGSYPASAVNPCNSQATCQATRPNWKADLVSPTMNDLHHHNQPAVLNGYLILNGNEEFFVWDVRDPTKPVQVTEFLTPNRCATCGAKKEGEAESQQVSFARYGDKYYEVTTSGYGVDIWNVTDLTKVVHVKSIKLEGVTYGDFTEAVWGMYWQGDTIYVGGTNTGLHILDAHDPENVTFVKKIPTSNFGMVNAGPTFAIGNILVVTTPKENGGIATFDITDPLNPITLAAIGPTQNVAKSYIGGFFRHYVFLQSPLRAYDVLTDPAVISTTPYGQIGTPGSEYMSFGDDYLFLGHLRPDGGATKFNISDPKKMAYEGRVWGRLDVLGANAAAINDDQFTVAIGPLLVMGDDQEPYRGSVIGVHSATPDTKPPIVDTVIPRDKAAAVSAKSRVGISFSDNIELATVDTRSFIVRPVGGQALPGKYGSYWGVLNFDPDQDFAPGTYEVVLPEGGITDLVGNAVKEFKSTFTVK
jgi:hypothetical protein